MDRRSVQVVIAGDEPVSHPAPVGKAVLRYLTQRRVGRITGHVNMDNLGLGDRASDSTEESDGGLGGVGFSDCPGADILGDGVVRLADVGSRVLPLLASRLMGR